MGYDSNPPQHIVGKRCKMSAVTLQFTVSGPADNVLSRQPVNPTLTSYRNAPVLERFVLDYNRTPAEAEICFEELKNFLAQAVVAARPIQPPSKDVDHMWHTFLLFTRDYAAFCQKC